MTIVQSPVRVITDTIIKPVVGGGGAPAFTPADLSDVRLWLDASDTSSITHVANAVEQHNDKSGLSKHATQTIAADKPTTGTLVNGLNAITYDQDFMQLPDELLSFTGRGPRALFMVLNVSATAAQSIVSPFNIGPRPSVDRGWWVEIDTATGGLEVNIRNSSTGVTSTVVLTPGTTQTLIINQTGEPLNTIDFYVDGGTKETPSSTSSGGPFVITGDNHLCANHGEQQPFEGIFCECVLKDNAFTVAEINNLGTYAQRWGTAWATVTA